MQHPVAVPRLQEPEGIAVDLPSQFLFYGFKDLFIHPLRIFHLPKIVQARVDSSLLVLLELVSSVLQTSDPKYKDRPLAFELTEPDFYFVLYWLRRANFTNVAFVHTTQCTNKHHLAEVAQGRLPKETLRISEYVTRSRLVQTQLDKSLGVPYVGQHPTRVKIRPRTMGAAADAAEYPEKFKRPDFEFRQNIAQCLDLPFFSALDYVDMLSPVEIEQVLDFEQEIGEYGVKEHIRVRCKHCNAEHETHTVMTPTSFLPVMEMSQVMDRKNLLAVQYHVYLPDTATVSDLWHMSDAAHAQREAKRKAIEDGLVWHG